MKYFILTVLTLGCLLSAGAQDFGWAASLGGNGFDHAYAVMVDVDGNVYTSGSFEGLADFDPGPDFTVLPSAGDADVFVTKLDADGHLVWAIRFGGITEDYGEALALDEEGNLYITGYFNGTTDFDPGSGTAPLTAAGDYDVFLSKLDADGQFIWARNLGGTDADQVRDMALDTAGHIVLTGHFKGTSDFDPGAGTYNLTSAGGNDIFIVKIDDAGDLVWANQSGGAGNDMGRGVAIDPDNNMLTTGRFEAFVDFDPGPNTIGLTSNGMEDVFISKLNGDGEFIWALNFGSTALDEGTAIHTDTAGRVYTAGFFEGVVDFDPGPDTMDLTGIGAEDIFISVLDADGAFIMSRQMGSAGLEKPHAIDTDTAGNIYTSGYFSGMADFDPDSTDFFLTSEGGLDAFVSKLSPTGEFEWVFQIGGPEDERSLDLVVGASARVYTSGYFSETVDFDPGMNEFILSSSGNTDIFVVVLDPCYPKYTVISPTACDSYTSPDGLEIWTVSGTYVDTLFMIGRCDSIITIQLTILNSTSSEISETACESYTSPDGLETWTTSGTYLDTIVNAAGCDSIITVQLTIITNTTSSTSETACDSYTSPDGLETWTVSGTYLDTLVNAAGCDSIITVQLTILNSTGFEIIAEACDSYDSPFGMESWTASGTYSDTLVNAVGCDSIMTVLLTIHNSTSSEITVEACDSYASPSNTNLWTQSGIYYDTIPNAAGCDSTITIDLTIHQNTASVINVTACDSLVSPSGQVWSASGSYQDIISNAEGCDSFMLINLTIIHSSAGEIIAAACDSYTSPSGNQIWTESGTYQDILPNAAGCDSIITVNLTINISPSLEITTEACDTYTSPTGAHVWIQSGTYQEIVPIPGECDSIITVYLTMHYSNVAAVEVTACENFESPDGTELWTESGSYLDTIPTAAGCDSFVTVVLTIVNNTSSTLSISACGSYQLPGGSQIWTESGTYQETIPNASGCDSLVTVNLAINNSSTSDLTTSACGSFLSPSTNYEWTASGVYTDTILNAGGCDSVMTIDLTIIHIDTAVMQSESVLTAIMTGASYQWIDCDNGNLPIAGETAQQFTATANGSYAVIISSDGCTEVSSCYEVTTVGNNDIRAWSALKLYPNPARDYFVIEPGRQIGDGVITVSDLQGRKFYTYAYRGEEKITVPFEGPSGIYMVSLTGAEFRIVGRVVME